MSANCPYCNTFLDPAPKRKKICPACGKPIYIRNGNLLTEFDALSDDWIVYLAPLNISKKQFYDTRLQLAREFSQPQGFYDVVLRILNNYVVSGRSAADIEYAYREMARVASFEQKDKRPYLAQALTTSLQAMKMRGIKRVVISCYAGEPDYSTCDDCRLLHGTKLTIDEALITLPIPNKCTQDTECRCKYVPLPD